MPLRTGAARMLLAAPAEVAAAMTLLPVGLLFHEPERFRTGWALVLVGRPVDTADCLRLYRTAPEEAVRRLTDRLAAALGDLIAEVGDRQTLRLVEEAEAIWLAESPERAPDIAARAEWRRRAAVAYRYLCRANPPRVRALRGELERYVKDLEAARMDEGTCRRRSPRGRPALRPGPGNGARAGIAHRGLGARESCLPYALMHSRFGSRTPSPTWRRRTSSSQGSSSIRSPGSPRDGRCGVWAEGRPGPLRRGARPERLLRARLVRAAPPRGPRFARMDPVPHRSRSAPASRRAAARDHAGAG